MPHLVTSRMRQSQKKHTNTAFSWERLSARIYKLGGILFVIGSLLFFPALSKYEVGGVWLFIIGSLLYLLVTGYDMVETHIYWQTHPTHTKADIIEKFASINYVLGSILFTIGSICFLPIFDTATFGAWCFIIGSFLFVVGGCANLLQIPSAPSMTYLQLFNFTLVTFIVGSALFLFASIPYIQHYTSSADTTHVDNLAASMFTIGSLLFWLGGEMIYLRQALGSAVGQKTQPSRFGDNFILSIRNEIASEQQHAKSTNLTSKDSD